VIQLINPSLITPYWDFTIESYQYGDGEWYQSNIYSNDYFGPVKTSSSDGYEMKTGYFTNIEVLYGSGLYYLVIFDLIFLTLYNIYYILRK
jgi:hypothetical protein